MKPLKMMLLVCLVLCVASPTAMATDETTGSRVVLETSKGNIVIALDAAAAPRTTANFLQYVANGFYDGTIFHRVIKGFMIQGGGFTAEMGNKSTLAPIANEADNGLKNRTGTIAMARTPNPHSATSQFFINTADNSFLDHTAKTQAGWGYCVFGQVVDGMEVVRAIESVSTTTRAGHRDVPLDPVIIERVAVVPADGEASIPKE